GPPPPSSAPATPSTAASSASSSAWASPSPPAATPSPPPGRRAKLGAADDNSGHASSLPRRCRAPRPRPCGGRLLGERTRPGGGPIDNARPPNQAAAPHQGPLDPRA